MSIQPKKSYWNEDAARKQREKRRANGNLHTHKYEKTPNGFLMRTYRNMKSRVTGIQRKKAHLYHGLPILPKHEFYEWAKKDINFLTLFEVWSNSHYNRLLTPSIDRIDSSKGYEKGNMRWLTHQENSRLGAISRNAA